jgi:uncharacterized protein YpmS
MRVIDWKKAFFILLGSIMVVILLFLITMLIPHNSHNLVKTESNELEDHVPFLIYTEKDHLNRVVNHYIQKETAGSPISYQVLLTDEVELYGTIPVFSQEIQLKMSFEPEVLENGDLILQQNSMSIGQMQLPVSYVLKFIADRYRLPKGVIIQPDEKRVYVSMQKLKLKSDFKVKVNKFNLKKDNISFKLYVPIK